MNEKFYDLKKEKQDRIINGALKVFALNGYRHASTDEMIMEAGISKGLLFHYFESKIGLYEFLFNYCSRFAVVELTSGVQWGETDYFRVQKSIAGADKALQRQYPYITLFLDSVTRETDEDALEALADSSDMVSRCYSSLLETARTDSFSGEDRIRLDSIIHFTKQGLLKSCLSRDSFDPDDLESEILSYLDFLQQRLS